MRSAILIVMMDFLLSSLLIFVGPEGSTGDYILNSSWDQQGDHVDNPAFGAFSPQAVDAFFQEQIVRSEENHSSAGADAQNATHVAVWQERAEALAAELHEKENFFARQVQQSKELHEAELAQLQKVLQQAEQDKKAALVQERGIREQMLAQQSSEYKNLLNDERARGENSIKKAVQESKELHEAEIGQLQKILHQAEQDKNTALVQERDIREQMLAQQSAEYKKLLEDEKSRGENSIRMAVQESSNALMQEYSAREQTFASREQAAMALLEEKDKEIAVLHENRGAVQQLQAQLAQKDGEVAALHGELGAAKAQLAALNPPTVDAFVSDAQVEVHNEFVEEGRWGSDIKLEANLIAVKLQAGDIYAVSSAESLGLLWKGMGSELKRASGYIAKRGKGASSSSYSTIYALGNAKGVAVIPLKGFAVNPLPLYKDIDQLRRSVNMQSLTFVTCAKDHEYTPFDSMNYTTHYKGEIVELRPKQTNNILINSKFKMDVGKGDFVVSNNGFFIGVMLDDKSFIMITEENFSAADAVFNMQDKQGFSKKAAEYNKALR